MARMKKRERKETDGTEKAEIIQTGSRRSMKNCTLTCSRFPGFFSFFLFFFFSFLLFFYT